MKPSVEPFDFLTTKREDIIRGAVIATNKRHKDFDKQVMHVYDRMPGKEKANNARSWLMAYIDEALSSDEGVTPRSFNGTIGFVFDDTYFIHFKKLITLDAPANEYKTLRLARWRQSASPDELLIYREGARQLEFDLPELEDPERPPELDELYLICAGYFREDGLITGFHFIDQDAIRIIDSRELLLVKPHRVTTTPLIQTPKFTIKGKADKKKDGS